MSTEKAPPAELVREIKELIIEALMLQDMRPEDIDEQAPLLVEGLGLEGGRAILEAATFGEISVSWRSGTRAAPAGR